MSPCDRRCDAEWIFRGSGDTALSPERDGAPSVPERRGPAGDSWVPPRSRNLGSPTLELQSVLSGGVGERLDPPVVKVAAAVEDDRGDARILGPLGDELADGRGGLGPLRL